MSTWALRSVAWSLTAFVVGTFLVALTGGGLSPSTSGVAAGFAFALTMGTFGLSFAFLLMAVASGAIAVATGDVKNVFIIGRSASAISDPGVTDRLVEKFGGDAIITDATGSPVLHLRSAGRGKTTIEFAADTTAPWRVERGIGGLMRQADYTIFDARDRDLATIRIWGWGGTFGVDDHDQNRFARIRPVGSFFAFLIARSYVFEQPVGEPAVEIRRPSPSGGYVIRRWRTLGPEGDRIALIALRVVTTTYRNDLTVSWWP